MIREGIGRVAPKPIAVPVGPKEWKEMTDEAIKRAKFRQYDESGDKWKTGLSRSVENPHNGEIIVGAASGILVGMVGEHAVSVWCRTGEGVDYRLRHEGDGGRDLSLFGIPLQVKTRRNKECLVRYSDFALARRLKRYVAYVFCELAGADALLLGWQHCTAKEKDFRVVPSRKFNGNNALFPDESLLPMNRLRAFCQARRPSC